MTEKNLYSIKSDFSLVKEDEKALEYHYSRYMNGAGDTLSKRCYQHVKLISLKERITNADDLKS